MEQWDLSGPEHGFRAFFVSVYLHGINLRTSSSLAFGGNLHMAEQSRSSSLRVFVGLLIGLMMVGLVRQRHSGRLNRACGSATGYRCIQQRVYDDDCWATPERTSLGIERNDTALLRNPCYDWRWTTARVEHRCWLVHVDPYCRDISSLIFLLALRWNVVS